MSPSERMARWLADTRLGRKALAEEPDLGVLRRRPGPRVWLGLGLIALSYLGGLPLMAVVGYHAHARGEPWILVVGGVAAFVLVHLVFLAGVWLAGGNYAKPLAMWGLRRYLQRYAALTPESE